MPLRVAVAGVKNVLGHVSYSIAFALLDTPDLEIVILTRNSSTADLSHFTSRGAEVKLVDYSSIPNLTSALDGVDTVISTFYSSQPVLNLITAATAAGVRRFAPSEFALSRAVNARLTLYEPKRVIWEALKESGLEYTSFQNGIFMDYFAHGAPTLHGGPMKKFSVVMDVSNHKATIPGTGEEPMTFMAVKDIGRFVAAAVKLEGKWPEELGMVGEATTYNQVVKEVEAVIGRKIEVEYLDKEQIAKRIEEAKADKMKFFFLQVFNIVASGLGSVEPTLNRLVPDVTPTSVRDFLTEYWGE